jgi:hypothetical protein
MSKPTSKSVPSYPEMPWSCIHGQGNSVIRGFVPASGDLQPVIEISTTAFLDAKLTAELIAAAVNAFNKHQTVIAELTAALELCLACDNLSWEAEHDAEIALARAKVA